MVQALNMVHNFSVSKIPKFVFFIQNNIQLDATTLVFSRPSIVIPDFLFKA